MSDQFIPEIKNRYAVCVGINDYAPTSQQPTLAYAENDARAFHDLLIRHGFTQDHCRLLLSAEATTEAIVKALKTFVLSKPGSDDLVLFYFAGHGLPIFKPEDELHYDVFLAAYNLPLQELTEESGEWFEYPLRMETLRTRFFERTPSKKVLFIFDSCYSGDFYGAPYRGNTDPLSYQVEQTFAGASAGHIVLSSCMPKQQARELSQLEHGLYTYHLLQALDGLVPEVVGPDGWITVNSLSDYLSRVLPPDQRPVRSGVEHGTFQLIRYPELISHPPSAKSSPHQPDQKRIESEKMLKALHIDHSGFIKDRRSSFVGRVKELAEIQQHVSDLLPIGGYVTITGQAGQGKSSVIAELVDARGQGKTAHHFIPFNPGPDYQVSILRDLMARLILKHNLSEIYVASESRAALRDFFPKVLSDLAEKGAQEVIFLDGLDQLKVDLDGERDLSFLPTNPPPGIVFVLGTRPNDTLRPLKLLKPHIEYLLPNLSRQDFDLILEHRGAKIEPQLANRFYKAMQENALYLNLVARELIGVSSIKHEEMIQRITSDPANIFSLSITRLKRYSSQWHQIIKPILGTLLVALEPLSAWNIRQLIGAPDDEVREGLERLGGLLAEDRKHRFSLFHLKLYDYLRQDKRAPNKEYLFALDEEQSWHKKLADWCEREDLNLIWQDIQHNAAEQNRREYARQHYITQLYYAQSWPKLFSVLDEGGYGRNKISQGPGTRSYSQDLFLGLQASMWEGRPFKEAIALLPQMWRYALLRSSLTSRADHYSLAMFEVLMLRKRETEALGLAELLTNPVYKVRALIQIAEYLEKEPARLQESIQLFLRACENINLIKEARDASAIISQICSGLIRTQQWAQAETILQLIEDLPRRSEVQKSLIESLLLAQKWEQAITIIKTITSRTTQTETAIALINYLVQAQQWSLIETFATSLPDPDQQTTLQAALAKSLAQAQQWQKAEETARAIPIESQKVSILIELGTALLQASHKKQAFNIWNEATTLAHALPSTFNENEQALAQLVDALAQTKHWSQAESLANTLKKPIIRERAFSALAKALAQEQQWQKAEAFANSSRFIQDELSKDEVLSELGKALIQAQKFKEAQAIADSIHTERLKLAVITALIQAFAQLQQWGQAKYTADSLFLIPQYKEACLAALGKAFAQGQQWDEAKKTFLLIPESDTKMAAIIETNSVFVQGQQWQSAKTVASSFSNPERQANILIELATALIQTKSYPQAEAIIRDIPDQWRKILALRRLMRELAQAQQWKQVDAISNELEAWTPSLEELRQRVTILVELHNALRQCSQYQQARSILEEAESLARSIPEKRQRDAALAEVSKAFAQTQQWQQARTIIDTIQNPISQADALAELASTHIQASHWEQAEVAINTILVHPYKAQALAELSSGFARSQQWEQVERILVSEPTASSYKEETLTILAKTFIQTQQWQQALALIPQISKIPALLELGFLFAQAHQSSEADLVWTRIEALANIRKDLRKRAQIQSQLAATLASIQHWHRASSVVSSISEWVDRVEAQQAFSQALSQAQQWKLATSIASSIDIRASRANALIVLAKTLALHNKEQWHTIMLQAQTTTSSIWDDWDKASTLCKLSITLAQIQQWSWAEETLQTIQIARWKAEALIELGKELARHQQRAKANTIWAAAETTIRSIEEQAEAARVLRLLSLAATRAQQWDRAERIARLIPLRTTRIDTIRELGKILLQADQWDRAITCWSEAQMVIEETSIELVEETEEEKAKKQRKPPVNFVEPEPLEIPPTPEPVLPPDSWRESILSALATDLQKTEDYERLLHLVQHMWLHADTRIYAINLLPLVNGLLPIDPSIGIAFHEAFPWVDTFLKADSTL